MGIVGGSKSSSGGSRSSSSSKGKGIVGGRAAPAAAAEAKAPHESMLMKTLNILDMGRRGVTAVVKELDDLVPGITKSDREQANGFHLSDIAKNYHDNIGAGDMTDVGNKWANRAIGLAGDIALDPLSYLTVGASSGAKAAASGGLKVGAHATAKDVAREALQRGEREVAEKVMSRGTRGTVNALSKEEAARYGIRQGMTVGVGKAKVAVPGGDKLARVVSDALAKTGATTRLANAHIGTGLATGIKDVSPVERMIARDSNRALRLEAKGTKLAAQGTLNQTLKEAGAGYDPGVIRDAMEGVGAPNEYASRITKTLDDVHQWASEKLGRPLPRREDYLSHRFTDEARDMKIADAGSAGRRGKTPTVLKRRGHLKGDIFYGQELQDGSISEMNAIFKKATGRNHNYWEDDPIKIAKQYIEDMTSMVAKSEEGFATEVIKRSGRGGVAPMKEVIPKDAKDAMREVKALDKQSKRMADSLDELRATKKVAERNVEDLDEVARHATQEANAQAAKLAVPESAIPGLLANLPDLKSQRAALLAAAGRDTTTATQELIDLTGAVRLEGQELLGEQAFLIPATGQVVPERNIVSHVDALLQVADLKARAIAARADVAAKLRPVVSEQAKTFDHIFVARDAEALTDAAAENAKKLDIASSVPASKDKLRVESFAKAEAQRTLRERAAHLYDEAARMRALGDDEMANIAALEAQARAMEAEFPNLDAKFQKAIARAGDVRHVRDLHSMAAQGLRELADGRFSEPWVAEAAKQMADAMTPIQHGKLLKEFDRMSSWWRASALLSPGYHARNAFGGMFNNMLAGMDWARYPEYRRTLKAFKAGGLDAIKDPVLREAWAAGAAHGFLQGEDISDVTKLIGHDGGHIIGTQNPIFRANFKAGERVEAGLRMPLFVDSYVKSGGNIDKAIDDVMRYHFDYEDLSKGEREVGRRAFGFYTWARNNLPLMMSEMADQPGKFNRYTHLKRNMELGTEEDPQKPGYFNRLLAIQVPGAKWKGAQIYWTPDLPFISAAGTAGEGYSGMLSNLNPLLKTPLETVTNRSFFENRNFSDTLRPGPTDPAFGTVLKVLARLPKGIPGVPHVYRAKDGSVMMDEREMNKIESMLPLLSRLRRLYPTEDKYQQRALSAWLSFGFGVGARTLDDAMRGGEMSRRKDALAAQQRRGAKLAGGQTLADFQAAERQALAIKKAQEGRRG